MTLFEIRVVADVISEGEVIPVGLEFSMTWCPYKKRKMGKDTGNRRCEDEGSEAGGQQQGPRSSEDGSLQTPKGGGRACSRFSLSPQKPPRLTIP